MAMSKCRFSNGQCFGGGAGSGGRMARLGARIVWAWPSVIVVRWFNGEIRFYKCIKVILQWRVGC